MEVPKAPTVFLCSAAKRASCPEPSPLGLLPRTSSPGPSPRNPLPWAFSPEPPPLCLLPVQEAGRGEGDAGPWHLLMKVSG